MKCLVKRLNLLVYESDFLRKMTKNKIELQIETYLMSKLFHRLLSKTNSVEGFTIIGKFKNEGSIEIHADVNVDKNDFKDLMNISIEFAKTGKIVRILPNLHYKDVR